MACEICIAPMALDEPTCTLLCNHTVHTECILRQLIIHEMVGIRCPSCNANVMNDTLTAEGHAVHGNDARNEIIQYMWHHEPQFKTGLEVLKQAQLQKAATYKALKKKEKEMVRNLEDLVEPFLGTIREKVKEAKVEYKESAEYKEHAKADKSHSFKWHAFRNKWDIGAYSIRMALRTIAAARSLMPTNVYMHRRRGDSVFNVVVR